MIAETSLICPRGRQLTIMKPWIIPIAKRIDLNIYRIDKWQGNFPITCLFKQPLNLGLNRYFSSNCWLGTKNAGFLSQRHQDWQCFPRKHGRRPTQRGPSLRKHVQTCKHGRPVPSMWLRFQRAGKLSSHTYQFALADKSRVRSRGGRRGTSGELLRLGRGG